MAQRSLSIYQKVLDRDRPKQSLLLNQANELEVSIPTAIEVEISEDLNP
jgi:hypothetical protein